MKFLILFALIASTGTAQVTEADFINFHDTKFHFVFRYPILWLPVDATHNITRFKAVSDAGKGSADVSVNVVPKPDAAGKPAEAYYKALKDSPQGLIEAMRKQIPSVKLVAHGETKISNQPAYYLLIDFTQHGGPTEIPIRMLQYSFGRDGYVYTITFRSHKEEWENNKPIFDYMAFGFAFSPAEYNVL